MMLRYTLPFPPTNNNLYANSSGGKRYGRHMTKAHIEWRRDAGLSILEQGRKSIKGQVVVYIALVAPDKRRRDVSNTIKAVEDLLVEMRVIEGDDNRYVQKVSAQWVDDGAPCTVLIHEYERGLAA